MLFFLILPLAVTKIKKLSFHVDLSYGNGSMELICASAFIGNIFARALPLDVLEPSGIFHAFNLYTIPLDEKNRTGVNVLTGNNCETKSSSLVTIPVFPLPPLFCARIEVRGVLLIYPLLVTVTITFSS